MSMTSHIASHRHGPRLDWVIISLLAGSGFIMVMAIIGMIQTASVIF